MPVCRRAEIVSGTSACNLSSIAEQATGLRSHSISAETCSTLASRPYILESAATYLSFHVW